MGIDLSDRTAQYCHLDASGEVEAAGRINLTPAGLQKAFGALAPIRMAIETGAQSGWVKRCLEAMGHEVLVANARELQSISGNSRKSDQRDAEQLARVDPKLLKPVELRSEGQQLDLMRIRARALLVDMRTKLVNGARGLAKVEGVRLPSSSTGGFAARAKQSLGEKMLNVLGPLLQVIEQLSAAITTSDEAIEQTAATQYPETRWLSQVPGAGKLTALTYVLTLGKAERFAHSRDVGPSDFTRCMRLNDVHPIAGPRVRACC